MEHFILFGSPALTWLSGLVLALFGLYYWSTSTDIRKIKGIPEIPGALPMYPAFLNEHKIDVSFGHLLKLGDV
jgi:hypothetical protein